MYGKSWFGLGSWLTILIILICLLMTYFYGFIGSLSWLFMANQMLIRPKENKNKHYSFSPLKCLTMTFSLLALYSFFIILAKEINYNYLVFAVFTFFVYIAICISTSDYNIELPFGRRKGTENLEPYLHLRETLTTQKELDEIWLPKLKETPSEFYRKAREERINKLKREGQK